jgi:5-methyltetrahydropteroyltriglutamate--homocysteine methyltransferase
MKTSTDRILTTHVGSLPRPAALVPLLVAKDRDEPHDAAALAKSVAEAVKDVVARQVACGIDIASDGEMSKISYVNYIKHRLSGFGDPAPLDWSPADMDAHPEYAQSLREPDDAPREDPPACRGPIGPGDRAPLDADLAVFRAAVDAAKPVDAFMNAASPGVIAMFMPNRHYASEGAYVEALAAALAEEYEAIHAAGFVLQIDCPDLAMARHMPFAGRPLEDFRRAAALNVEALNEATRNLPAEAMRMHVCWGNYPGPHTHDVAFREIADIVFTARPQAVLFEAANPRHAHEWEDLAEINIPEDKILIPGVIDTLSSTVEHPALIAQQLLRFADIVGRERVMAGTDCGFATLASLPRVWPSIAWEKLHAMAEGAARASERLWGGG